MAIIGARGLLPVASCGRASSGFGDATCPGAASGPAGHPIAQIGCGDGSRVGEGACRHILAPNDLRSVCYQTPEASATSEIRRAAARRKRLSGSIGSTWLLEPICVLDINQATATNGREPRWD